MPAVHWSQTRGFGPPEAKLDQARTAKANIVINLGVSMSIVSFHSSVHSDDAFHVIRAHCVGFPVYFSAE